MVTCSLDALNKSSKKEMRIKNEMVEVLQQPYEILDFDLVFVG